MSAFGRFQPLINAIEQTRPDTVRQIKSELFRLPESKVPRASPGSLLALSSRPWGLFDYFSFAALAVKFFSSLASSAAFAVRLFFSLASLAVKLFRHP